MLDIGWTELLVIAVVLIVVVGPKDLPPMLRAFGKMTSNLRKMAGDFRTQFDQALREADMDDVRQTISDAQRFNPANVIREAINPLREMGNEIRNDLQKSTEVPQAGENRIGGEHASTVGELLPTPELSLPETAPLVAPAPAAAQPATGPAATPSPAAATVAAAAASSPLAVPAAKAIAPPEAADGQAAAVVKKPRAPRKQKVAVATAPEIETPAVKPAAKRTRVAKAAETGAGELAAVKPAPRRRKPTTPKDSA